MNIVLLSGGSGQRLWPLSNEIRSKQFIKIFHKEDGELESMVQRVYRQIRTVDTDATVTIATSKSQVSAIHNQLGENVGISVEPCRRDTFPAIALAAAYLKDVQHIGEQRCCDCLFSFKWYRLKARHSYIKRIWLYKYNCRKRTRTARWYFPNLSIS